MSAVQFMAENVKTRSPAIREQARGELALAVADFTGKVQEALPKYSNTAPRREAKKPVKAAAPVRPRNPNTLPLADVLRVVGSRDNLSLALGTSIDWKSLVPTKFVKDCRDLMLYWPLLQRIKQNFQNGRTVLQFAKEYGYSPVYIQELSDRFRVQFNAEVAHVLP